MEAKIRTYDARAMKHPKHETVTAKHSIGLLEIVAQRIRDPSVEGITIWINRDKEKEVFNRQ